MKKTPHITIKIRRDTKSRLDKDLAAYIGRKKKVISMAEYIDRLSRLRVK
ncbi:MAG: hypothetical protein JRE40_01180 [Deltaproteobacteria bacterium]|nr:hypothetical protein [Deltaproteobacteria bacterium]